MEYTADDLFTYLASLPYGKVILALVSAICTIILVVIQLYKLHLQKKYNKENENLKTRLENYREKEHKTGTVFVSEVPEYSYDKNTKQLVETGVKDLQALVQSSEDCALNKILEKLNIDPASFAPIPRDNIKDVDDIADLSQSYQDDLDILREYSQEVQEIRSRYNIPFTTSDEDMFRLISEEKVRVDARIDALKNKPKEQLNNEETSDKQ